MIEHVVWDWNGTLLADVDAVLEASRHALGAVGATVDLDLARYRSTFRRPLREFYTDLVGRVIDDADWATLGAAYARSYGGTEPGLPLADDAVAALDRLRDAGIGQSLLSLHGHDDLVATLDRRGLTDRFTRVDGDRRGAGTVGGGKAAALAAHLAALGRTPAQVVLIGDTVDDAAAATEAGAGCVLVARHSIHHASDLHEIVPRRPVVDTLVEAVDAVVDSRDRSRPGA